MRTAFAYPYFLGHEGGGTVVAVGERVRDFAVGDQGDLLRVDRNPLGLFQGEGRGPRTGAGGDGNGPGLPRRADRLRGLLGPDVQDPARGRRRRLRDGLRRTDHGPGRQGQGGPQGDRRRRRGREAGARQKARPGSCRQRRKGGPARGGHGDHRRASGRTSSSTWPVPPIP